MKKILFSPIGGTDPITNFHDGAMLHICRVYKPDVVYLYLSKEMCEYQKIDNRYTRVIELLSTSINQSIEIVLIEDNDMKEVQIFDAFISLFEKKITEIYDSFQEEVQLIVNVSSGTPAMKSSLQILAFMYPKIIPIQVSTPVKSLNKTHEDRENYGFELQWEYNEDNNSNFVNRCIESKAASLQDRLKKDIICNFIDKYDYRAAEYVMEGLVEHPDKQFMDLLKIANYRSMLNIREIQKISSKLNKELFPICASNEIDVFEYMLSLILKWKKGEYADFIRAITPISTELMKRTMENNCNILVSDFANKKSNGSYVISSDKVRKNQQIYNAFVNEFNNKDIRETDVTSIQYKAIICSISDNSKVIEVVSNIRSVESNVRNLAAHQVVSITEEFIQKQTGFTMEQIIKMLKQLIVFAGVNVKQKDWNVYEVMNEQLKKLLLSEK